MSAGSAPGRRRFAVALSFPGEHRGIVEGVAAELASTLGRERVLYDRYHDAEFARPELDLYLSEQYRDHSELVVVFLCADYAAKRFCRLEWRQIRQLIFGPNAERIMLVSFGDPGDLATIGVMPGDGYIDIARLTPEQVAAKILTRHGLGDRRPSSGAALGARAPRAAIPTAPVPSPAAALPGPAAAAPYPGLFQVASCVYPYIPIVSSFEKGEVEYRWHEVSVQASASTFTLPADLAALPLPAPFQQRVEQGDDPDGVASCRFLGYSTRPSSAGFRGRLTLRLSRTRYVDYLRSGENLDAPLPGDPKRSFRDKYAPQIASSHSYDRLELTNICGVGLFLLTSDNKLIVARHSRDVTVFPDVLSYSASGTMDWNRVERPFTGDVATNAEWLDFLSPFAQVARECREEIGYRVSQEELRLIAVGIDARKLYFQFSFVEQTASTAAEIQAAAQGARDFHREMERLVEVPFELDALANLLRAESWEPAAAATLLCLAAQEFGLDRLERALDEEFVRNRWRQRMRAEWRKRAQRPGDLAVMSTRYPQVRIAEESRKFVEAQLAFIGGEADGKDVVEIGAGIGRLTERLVPRAARLTCVEMSDEMIGRNRARLGALAERVRYVRGFGQDYRQEPRHDLALCSMVFVHHVDGVEFERLAAAIAGCAEVVFLFEHVGEPLTRLEHTRIRSEEELLAAFPGFVVARRQEEWLFEDRILFFKLVAAGASGGSAR